MWVLETGGLHVRLGAHSREHPHPGCRCVSHWDAEASAFGVVQAPRAIVQLLACQGEEAFFAALESALHTGLIGDTERDWIRERVRATARWLVDLAATTSESGLESLVRLRLHRLGIPLEAQVEITGVGRVDLVLDGRIIIEADGHDNHDGPSKRHKDLVRDANAAARGFITLRFDYAMIVHDWPLVEAAILRARATVAAE